MANQKRGGKKCVNVARKAESFAPTSRGLTYQQISLDRLSHINGGSPWHHLATRALLASLAGLSSANVGSVQVAPDLAACWSVHRFVPAARL